MITRKLIPKIREKEGLPSTHFSERKLSAGFTLVELVVGLGIIILLTGVALANYNSARNTFRLDATVQEIILALREAQVYGTTVLENPSNFNSAYGVYFQPGQNQYTTFIDLNDNDRYEPLEELEVITLPNGFTINDVCVAGGPINWCNSSQPWIENLNVYFKRPNPDAQIFSYDSLNSNLLGPYSTGRVEIQDNNGTTMTVIIEESGQIYVQ